MLYYCEVIQGCQVRSQMWQSEPKTFAPLKLFHVPAPHFSQSSTETPPEAGENLHIRMNELVGRLPTRMVFG